MRAFAGCEKTDRKPWLKKQWGIPAVSSELVAAMEDVLEVYAEPYAPTRPKVHVDETSKQRSKETRQPLPAQPGKPQRFDDDLHATARAISFSLLNRSPARDTCM